MKISLHSKCFLPSKVFACPWRQEKDSWHKNWYLPHHSLSCKKRNSLNYCFKRFMYQIDLTEEDFSAHSWKQQSVPAMAFAYSRHICAYMIFSLILGGRGGGKRCTIEDENNNEGSFWLRVKREFSICDWFFTSRFSLKFNAHNSHLCINESDKSGCSTSLQSLWS